MADKTTLSRSSAGRRDCLYYLFANYFQGRSHDYTTWVCFSFGHEGVICLTLYRTLRRKLTQVRKGSWKFVNIVATTTTGTYTAEAVGERIGHSAKQTSAQDKKRTKSNKTKTNKQWIYILKNEWKWTLGWRNRRATIPKSLKYCHLLVWRCISSHLRQRKHARR